MELINKNQVIQLSKELYKKPKINGLYFLIWKSQIVYVGSGNDVWKRITAHKQTPVKKFTKYFIMEREERDHDLFKLESEYIRQWRPIYNKTGNPDYHNDTKPLWFIYISQEESVAEISKKLGIDFQKVNNVIKGKRQKRDEIFERVRDYLENTIG